MATVSAEQVLKEFHDIGEHMQNELKARDEKIAEVSEAAKKALEMAAQYRRENVSPFAPVDDIQALYAQQRGGIFGGKFRIPYRKMISLSTAATVLNGSEKERLRTIHDLHDACVLRWWHLAKKRKPGQGENWMREQLMASVDFQMYADHLVRSGYFKAANDILNPAAGEGANLDFTLLSAQLIDLVRIDALVAAQFPEITLTRAKQDYPALRSDVIARLGGGLSLPEDDSTGVGAMPPANALLQNTFGQIEFDAVHCLGFLAYTDDQLEDSIVPLLPILRSQAATMITRAQDTAIINGDTTATHQDEPGSGTSASRVSTAYDFRKAWDGLRKMGENNEYDPGTAEISSADLNQLMRKMGKYATNPNQLVWFMNVIDWLKLAADTNLATVDKIGVDRAGLRQGVINQVGGVNIVVSEYIWRDLNTSGIYDNVTTDNTITVLCNTTRFWLARKGELDIESVRVPQALGNWIQADLRCDFQALDKNKASQTFAAGVAPVAIAVDITA